MQPTLFTAIYTADRAAEPLHASRPVGRIRLRSKAVATALAAVAVGTGLLGAASAQGNPAPDDRQLGAADALVTAGAITAPGQFGWKDRCPYTGAAKR